MTLDNRNTRIGFVGAGTLGSGLAVALHQRGYNVCAVSSRTRQSAEDLAASIPGCMPLESCQEVACAADLVFVTTPDSAITPVTASALWRPGQAVVHCCGAAGRELLQPAFDQGAETGTLHPFQTFAGIAGSDAAVARLTGVTFAVSAEGGLADFLTAMALDLGGQAVAVEGCLHSLYHAAAILSCGYLVTLLGTAVESLEASGISREDALQAVAALATTTLDNVKLMGLEASVTGPLVRGDAATVRNHLEALRRHNPGVATLYGTLTELSLPVALKRGLGSADERAICEAVAELGS